MNGHIRAVGIIYLIFGVMGLIAGLIVLTLIIGGGIAGTIATGDGTFATLATIFGTIIAAIILVSSVPAVLAGYGIIRHRQWGRILGTVVGIINLFNFPIGTAIGGYALWVLFHHEVTPRFSEPYKPVGQTY